MRNFFKRYENNPAAYVAHFRKSSNHRRQPITLSMIAMELENDLIELRSLFVKAIIKVFGINRK